MAAPIVPKLLNDRYLCLPVAHLYAEHSLFCANRGLGAATIGAPAAGAAEIANPVGYRAAPTASQRILVYDLVLQRWGSCDTEDQHLFSFTAINASGTLLLAQPGASPMFYDNRGTSLGIIGADGALYIADHNASTGLLYFGYPKFHAFESSRLVALFAELRQAGEFDILVQGHGIGHTALTSELYTSPTNTGLIATLPCDVSGKYFTLTLSGRFALRNLFYEGYALGVW